MAGLQLDRAVLATLRNHRGEVERAAELGRLRPGVEVESATATFGVAMQGVMMLARAGMPSDELSRRARAVVSSVATT